MNTEKLIGFLIIALVLAAALMATAWVARRQQRKQRTKTTITFMTAPQEGDTDPFALAVWRASQAANELQRAIAMGTADHVYAALHRAHTTGHTLAQLLDARALAAKQRGARTVNQERADAGLPPYAGRAGSVTVSESDRLAGEPHEDRSETR